tara:strand:+ start:110 stop:361 length:252 start_codon:yes stop_codon:yes gene_type:complete
MTKIENLPGGLLIKKEVVKTFIIKGEDDRGATYTVCQISENSRKTIKLEDSMYAEKFYSLEDAEIAMKKICWRNLIRHGNSDF